MGDFNDAQILFGDYQKHGNIQALENSLEILEEIIDEKGVDSQKAISLKNSIGKHIDKQIKGISKDTNLSIFLKGSKSLEENVSVIAGALDDKQITWLIKLTDIIRTYFSHS